MDDQHSPPPPSFAPNPGLIAFAQREIDRVRPQREMVKGYLAELHKRESHFPAAHLGVLAQSIEYHELLELAVARRNVELAAWASRGLIEMRIWTLYLIRFPAARSNLERNYWLEQVTILDSLASVSVARSTTSIPDFAGLRAQCQAEVRAHSITPVRTAQMVKELGLESEYFPLNQMLSKLVHPTAYLLMSRAKGQGGIEAFLSAVCWHGLSAFLDIWKELLPTFRNGPGGPGPAQEEGG